MNQIIPTKFKLLGKEYQTQNILAVCIIAGVIIAPFLNKGGSTELPLPKAAEQMLMNDLGNIVSEAKQKGAAEAQFDGVLADNVDQEAIAQASIEVAKATNTLSAGGQLFILSLVEEKKTELIAQYEKEANNPNNKNCYAVDWKVASCLQSILINRKSDWDEAKNTSDKDDDLLVAFNNLVLALATQEIISRTVSIETPLVEYYKGQLQRDGLTVNSDAAYAQIAGLQAFLSKALDGLQAANEGSIAKITGETKAECLGGVLNAEQLKKCGGAQ
jgi:hypothetical protein